MSQGQLKKDSIGSKINDLCFQQVKQVSQLSGNQTGDKKNESNEDDAFQDEEFLVDEFMAQRELCDVRKGWTTFEEEKLLEMHNQFGNRWTEIGIELNKDHNTVKNHFYAEIRKSLRRINIFIKYYLKSQHKELNLSQISKVITLVSEKKKKIPHLSEGNIFTKNQIKELKSDLFYYAKFEEGQNLNEKQISELSTFLSNTQRIVSQLRNLKLIGKKNSAYKQARQQKIKQTRQKNVIKKHQKKKCTILVEPIAKRHFSSNEQKNESQFGSTSNEVKNEINVSVNQQYNDFLAYSYISQLQNYQLFSNVQVGMLPNYQNCLSMNQFPIFIQAPSIYQPTFGFSNHTGHQNQNP